MINEFHPKLTARIDGTDPPGSFSAHHLTEDASGTILHARRLRHLVNLLFYPNRPSMLQHSLRSRLYPFLDWDDSRSEFGLCKEIQRSRTLLPPPPYSNIRVLQTLSRIEKCGDSSARELANPVESVYGHQKIWVWREAHQFRSLLPSMCSSFYNLCFGRLISTSVSPDPSHLYLVLLITKYPTRRSKATNAASYLYLGPSSTDCEYTHQSLEFVGTYVTLPYVPR